MPRKTTTLHDYFWARVSVTDDDGCWEWTGHRMPKGYGMSYHDARNEGRQLAHRLSYELNIGPIPDDLGVLHRCDNPSCVRPDHLFVGDQVVNMRDAIAKGRWVGRYTPLTGEGNPRATVTEEEVREIRQMYDDGMGQTEIGDYFGIPKSTIHNIVHRNTWKHVT